MQSYFFSACFGVTNIHNIYLSNHWCNERHFATPQNVADFVSPDERINKSRICTKYKRLISCIQQEWINMLRQDTSDRLPNIDHTFTLKNQNLNSPLKHTKSMTAVVYKSHNPPISLEKWEDVLTMSQFSLEMCRT